MKADALTLEGRLVLLRPTAVLLAFPAAPTDVGEGKDGERPARFMDIEKVSVIPTLERKATDIARTVLRYSAVNLDVKSGSMLSLVEEDNTPKLPSLPPSALKLGS